jgi:hypothetical protein
MFDELRVRLRQNKFSTPTNFEGQLLIEVLDEVVSELRAFPTGQSGSDCTISKDEIDILLDTMEFISQRKPITIEETKNV